MTVVCETLGVARSNIARRVVQGLSKRRGCPALPEEPLLSQIMAVIVEMPSYGYPRVCAVLRRRSEARGDPPVNRKRVYRIMKKHSLLLLKHAGGQAERQHDGVSRSSNPISDGAPMDLKLPATMQNGFVSRLLSTAVTEKLCVAARNDDHPELQ
jgi:hypothetical protein